MHHKHGTHRQEPTQQQAVPEGFRVGGNERARVGDPPRGPAQLHSEQGPQDESDQGSHDAGPHAVWTLHVHATCRNRRNATNANNVRISGQFNAPPPPPPARTASFLRTTCTAALPDLTSASNFVSARSKCSIMSAAAAS